MLRMYSFATLALLVLLPRPAASQIAAPISKGSVAVELKPVASGLVSPDVLVPAPDGSGRLIVADQAGRMQLVGTGGIEGLFGDLTSRLVGLNSGYDERGLLGLAFNPDFNTVGAQGYHKVYTYSSEPVRGPADFTVPLPPGTSFDHQSVVNEWHVSASGPLAIDTSVAPREILQIDEPQSNHNGGNLAFGPDRNLYISLGDGGAANDVAPGHTPGVGNGQDTSNVLGTVLRIDVSGNSAANGQYSVPADNPFVSGGGVPEIFASGFRNPFRFSFDSKSGDLIVADVGQNHIEEIDLVTSGGNFGWHTKEGTFLFDPATGEVLADSPGAPAGLIDPVAQYDHDEGIAIVGGFVYHGTAIPELEGKYVFGDFSQGFGSPAGRLFYADLNTGLIQELVIGLDDRELGLFVKGFGQDENGELYLLASSNLGPSGTTGVVLELISVPEPGAAFLSAIALSALAGISWRERSRRRRATAC
jgi:glucose/arabinose dehydrogenase